MCYKMRVEVGNIHNMTLCNIKDWNGCSIDMREATMTMTPRCKTCSKPCMDGNRVTSSWRGTNLSCIRFREENGFLEQCELSLPLSQKEAKTFRRLNAKQLAIARASSVSLQATSELKGSGPNHNFFVGIVTAHVYFELNAFSWSENSDAQDVGYCVRNERRVLWDEARAIEVNEVEMRSRLYLFGTKMRSRAADPPSRYANFEISL